MWNVMQTDSKLTHGQSQTNIPINFFEAGGIKMLDSRTPEDVCTTRSPNEP